MEDARCFLSRPFDCGAHPSRLVVVIVGVVLFQVVVPRSVHVPSIQVTARRTLLLLLHLEQSVISETSHEHSSQQQQTKHEFVQNAGKFTVGY